MFLKTWLQFYFFSVFSTSEKNFEILAFKHFEHVNFFYFHFFSLKKMVKKNRTKKKLRVKALKRSKRLRRQRLLRLLKYKRSHQPSVPNIIIEDEDDEMVGGAEPTMFDSMFDTSLNDGVFIGSSNVDDFFKDCFTSDGNINLDAVGTKIDDTMADTTGYESFYSGSRDDQAFIPNEMKKMNDPDDEDIEKEKWMFPHITNIGGFPSLQIPMNDVFDLPIYVKMYVYESLAEIAQETPSFSLQYSVTGETNAGGENIVLMDMDEIPITVTNAEISRENFDMIYNQIMRTFMDLYPEGEASWNGSEESGTRILIRNGYMGGYVTLSLNYLPARSAARSGQWTQQIENVLQSTVKGSVLSVRNREDHKCLIYCLIMGLIAKVKGGEYSRLFRRNDFMIESSEIYTKAMYRIPDDANDLVTQHIKRLARLLLPVCCIQSNGSTDPLYELVQNIDMNAGTMLSLKEFREEFANLEKQLIPEEICGIDVYGLDFNVSTHIYPLYMSSNRNRNLELLCVTPIGNIPCSHYCLIMNKETLFRNSGGKQFFSCSKCGQTFFHRRILLEHNCPMQLRPNEVPDHHGYHFSQKTDNPVTSIVVGCCSKCRLCFSDVFKYNYHKTHCFMDGKTGYRHVQLLTYNSSEHPVLKGEALDMDEENKHVARRRVLYADFECTIDPESGEHSFMSFGIYDILSDQYVCGYNLNDFFQFILKIAFENTQDLIYVYFHNAMGYDANFILRHVMKTPEYVNWGIQVIMKSMNRLQKLVFYIREDETTKMIHIGDTFLFLTLSLERIVGSIRRDDIEMNEQNFPRFFHIFKMTYPMVTDEDINHILRKNIFPYKFFVNSEMLQVAIETFLRIFEPKEENLKYFSERVTLEDLRESYEDTKHVIEVFDCKSAKDYHDLYLRCDVMQLADVFERSMEILWESHHIHLTKYLGMPSASWAAFLRHNPDMRIPLYEDTFFAEFFKGMIRGGITSAPLRHAVADENHSIIYLDVNGLYPFVMQAYDFPCGKFEFVPMGWEGEMCLIKLEEYYRMFEEQHKGMCFCVDLKIPDEVKYRTDMYPFAPEHRKIMEEYYSDARRKTLTPFLQKWSDANKGEKMLEFKGLVCTLYDKEKYNVHWRLLKFYIEHGIIVTKIYFGVLFDEGSYLAGYIRKNIEIRNTRKDELGKTLYKLLGNSIYGKTFESPFKRNKFEIVRDLTRLQGLYDEGNIAALTPVDEYGWIVRMDGDNIILDKPTFIGACVCEFAKLHMYTLLYDKLMHIFPSVGGEIGCQLVYTDTDSFIVRVRHPIDIPIHTPEELFAYIKSKDATLIGGIGGQIKSETGEDDTISEIIALRSKVYAYITRKGHLGKRAKGTTYDAQELQLDWETYKQTLESLQSFTTKNAQFVRKVFKITSFDMFRQSLSVNDGKRFICEDGIHTHAFGYPGL